MSAKISSSKIEAGGDLSPSVEEAATGVGDLNIEHHEDPADFLLSTSKYHDCFLIVGNPECEKVEKIGVTSVDLIAHSPVFRKMLEKREEASNLPDFKINITDVSPDTFKLMLRYVYGGKLPQMTAIEAAGLALCGDKYKISRLAHKALKRLRPTSAKDVFPALICVTYASFPDLEVQVSKIIQQETDQVVQNPDFLKLAEECVLYILKQHTLNISELELWKNVVRWAENQVRMNPNRTVRECLVKMFGYVRFLTFTLEEFLDHVLPTKILTPEEFMNLTLALTKKQQLESTVLCQNLEKRVLYKGKKVTVESAVDKKVNETLVEVLGEPENAKFTRSYFFQTSDRYNFDAGGWKKNYRKKGKRIMEKEVWEEREEFFTKEKK